MRLGCVRYCGCFHRTAISTWLCGSIRTDATGSGRFDLRLCSYRHKHSGSIPDTSTWQIQNKSLYW